MDKQNKKKTHEKDHKKLETSKARRILASEAFAYSSELWTDILDDIPDEEIQNNGRGCRNDDEAE